MQRALVINSNIAEFQTIEKALKHLYPLSDIINVSSIGHGLEILSREKFDAIFINFPPKSIEPDFFETLQKMETNTPVIAMIERGKEIMAAEAIKKGAYDYLIKYPDCFPNTIYNLIEGVKAKYLSNLAKLEGQREEAILFQQIIKSYKWWQSIIDAITDYLFVIDDNHNILRTNKTFASLFNKEPADIIMKRYYELFGLNAPHDWCIAPKSSDNITLNPVERNINDRVFLISSFPIFMDEQKAMVYVMKDITEIRRLKDQIHHLDKLSSLGTLTSGVAHEINNPLTGIIGYTEMLLMKDGKDETIKRYLNKIYESAIRCKRIVENMLVFSRQTLPQKSIENINEVIDRTIELHEYSLRKNKVEINKSYDEVPYLAMDRQQMQQVILNLLINAEHAILEANTSGEIKIKTIYDKEGKHIVLIITDNGTGIPKEILPKIFDPFFTTKPVNVGTGLGLSIAHGIITEQGGTIEVESTVGEGTTFTITLPQTNY